MVQCRGGGKTLHKENELCHRIVDDIGLLFPLLHDNVPLLLDSKLDSSSNLVSQNAWSIFSLVGGLMGLSMKVMPQLAPL